MKWGIITSVSSAVARWMARVPMAFSSPQAAIDFDPVAERECQRQPDGRGESET